MQYKIRLTELEEKDELLALYNSMIGLPGCTWSEDYPNAEIILWDIENKQSHCLLGENGEIIAVASVCVYDDGGLNDVDCYTSVEKWAEFVRVAVNREYQNKGFAKILLNEIIKILKEKGFDSVRLLVSDGNITAKALYEKLGFKWCGEAYLHEHDWLCYELILKEAVT